MPAVSQSIVVDVRPEQFLSVVADFERYPEFLSEVKKVTVNSRTAQTAEVTYEIELIKRLRYTLRTQTDGLNVTWSLVSGDLFKQNNGGWSLAPEGETGTRATYSLDVAFGGFIPVPKMITDSLTAGSLPGMLKNFKARAEQLFPRTP